MWINLENVFSLIFKNKLAAHELRHYKLCSSILKTDEGPVLSACILSSILQKLSIIKFQRCHINILFVSYDFRNNRDWSFLINGSIWNCFG